MLEGDEVDDCWEAYLANLPAKHRSAVEATLGIAQEAVPEASAGMPYGVPGLMLQGKPLLAVAAHKGHLGVYPFSPDVVSAIARQLVNVKTSKGTIRFAHDDPPTEDCIREFVKLRSKEILSAVNSD